MRRLRRENDILRKARDILKKALAIFSHPEIDRFRCYPSTTEGNGKCGSCAGCWQSRKVASTTGSSGLPRPRSPEDGKIAERIVGISQQHKGRYGSPRIHQQLQDEGIHVGRKRVIRLMRTSPTCRAPYDPSGDDDPCRSTCLARRKCAGSSLRGATSQRACGSPM
jgi:hypothetical protein